MKALLRRLVRLERRLLSRSAPRPVAPDVPAVTLCERCGLLVETACWHCDCPLTGERPAR